MGYTVLARRYRSQSFDEVVGQEAIARTLTRAIEHGKTAHAYLFVGTRGVGKTSTARIFAKAMNCPTDEPAEVAQAIMQGRDTDVIEIDAASHGNVEEARDLIARSGIRPLRGMYKVYIIDEVHMLSSAAFNALLKTMEEPPEHVKFILCTTEAHKVPATIQSRCQRFDFRAIPTERIAAHLRSVLSSEKIEADDDVVERVAELGAGSMRDALSILDRLIAAREDAEAITLDRLQMLLGLAPDAMLADLIDAVADADIARALVVGRDLLAQGLDVEHALQAIASAMRDVMALAVCGEATDLVASTGARRARAASAAQRIDALTAAHMVALCDAVAQRARNSAIRRELFDVAIVRLAGAGSLANAAALLSGKQSGATGGAKPGRGSRGSPLKKA